MAAFAFVLATASVPIAGESTARQGICTDTPEPGGRIDCEEPADSSADIDIEARDLAITTTDDEAHAVGSRHEGAGDIGILARSLTLETQGTDSDGISASHAGTGNIDIDAGAVVIVTGSRNADGLHGLHEGAGGGIRFEARNSEITTSGDDAEAILAIVEGTGDIGIVVRETSIATQGTSAEGVHGLHRQGGDVHIDARDSRVSTMGAGAFALRGSHGGTGAIDIDLSEVSIETDGRNADGVLGMHVGSEGAVRIDAQGGEVTTKGEEAEAVLAILEGAGDIGIVVRDAAIRTEGDGAEGIHGLQRDDGEVRIDVRGAKIATTGAAAAGVRGSHGGTGDIRIDARDADIATMHERAHGMVGWHAGSGSIRITVDGGSVHAAGVNASGIQVGNIDRRGRVSLAAEVGEDGYRKQSVVVNGPVTGGSHGSAAGVFLAGGGRVVVGPKGSVGAESGVAIRAAGDASRLHVELNLDGRRVRQVIGESAILNQEGETTVLVNGIVLHEGASGATGVEAPNGVWDVALPESPTVAGRAFSHEDFTAVHAPRAAVYEALPGFLLRLNGRGVAGERVASPGSNAWAGLSYGNGSYEAERSSVGAKYDFRSFGVEAGVTFPLGESLDGSVSARFVDGTAEVESPAGDGEIEAAGIGAALEVSWSDANGRYAAAGAALTHYDVDASTEKRGRLTGSVGAIGYSVGLEAGRRIELDEKMMDHTMTLTPRARMTGAGISRADFTDAVGSRVSRDGARRLTGGLGLIAETVRAGDEESLSLRASLDVERALGGAETTADVSGEKLRSQSAGTRVLLGLGGTWRQGPLSLVADISAGGVGSDDGVWSGRLELGMTF